MPRFNQDVASRFITEIRRAVHRLETLKNIPRDDFLRDPDKIDSAKYNFIVAIESAVDLGSHIVARNALRAPKDYADTFEVLKEAGAFDESFTPRLKAMARFRNRLVHLYWEVEDESLRRFLEENLDDFARFLRDIARFMEL